MANAWHHRSDALSSLGTLVGIACAYFLGQKWRIADPIAALVVAVFIFKVAFDLVRTGLNELLERSLPADVEEEILRIVTADPEVCQPHNLRTRRIGAAIAVEVHVRMDGAMTVARSHALTVDIERRLRARFGEGTMIAIHVEPLKYRGAAGRNLIGRFCRFAGGAGLHFVRIRDVSGTDFVCFGRKKCAGILPAE